MLLLASTSDVLKLATSTANALHVNISYLDRDSTGTSTYGRPANAIISAINAAPGVTVLSAPAASTIRNVKDASFAAVGGPNIIEVYQYDGATNSRKIKIPLNQDDVLLWSDTIGWRVFDASGQEKQIVTTPGRFLRNVVVTSGTTWTAPADCTKIFVRVMGGGGGGAGAAFTASNASAGGGGGAGGYLEATFTVVPGTAYTIAIGALGAGGTAGANNGSNGGNTTMTVGGITVTAGGGQGGIAQAAGTTAAGSLGGAGGTATNGDLNAPGSRGVRGFRFSGTAGVSGAGASSEFGGGGSEAVVQNPGGAATGFGAGGGGALGLTATAAGGAGTAGCISIDQYA